LSQVSSIIKNSSRGISLIKRLVGNGSFEWKVYMPKKDYNYYLSNLNKEEAVKGKDVEPVILISRLYLDADLVTEMARDKNSNQIFIQTYPEELKVHWLQINTDMQAFNKLMAQIKVLLLGFTSIVYLADVDIWVAATFLVGNIGSFVFPKAFGKSLLFIGKYAVKMWSFIFG
jgi:hypothetical protein